MLTEYLLGQGHEHIAFVSSPEERTSSIEERVHGFTSAFLNHGKAIHSDAIFTQVPPSTAGRRAGEETLRRYLREHPHFTAFVACEYEIALFLSHVLQSQGQGLGQGEGAQGSLGSQGARIVCFDSPITPYERLRYTHIRQNEWEIARQAIRLLLNQIRGEAVPLHTVVDYAFNEYETN